jgi:predicted small metal-binding protein
MKTISCKELGGACSHAFRGSTFEEVANQSQQHGAEMVALADQPHLDAMSEMMTILESGHVEEWMNAKMELFELLPDDGE